MTDGRRQQPPAAAQLAAALQHSRRELEVSRAEIEALAAAHRQREAALERALAELTASLAAVKNDVERIGASHSWRIGHAFARAASRLKGRRSLTEGAVVRALARLERLERPGEQNAGSPAVGGQPIDRAQTARAIRSRLGPPRALSRWPFVSIIVLNRDGVEHLRRLVDGLQRHTDYPHFEVIVVDNASSDESRAYLEGLRASFPVTALANDRNIGFSEGNAAGAARASGELLLFLNNDVEPFESGWMKELVHAVGSGEATAAGAMLLHPTSPGSTGALVQHGGIRFRFERAAIRAHNLDDGKPLFGSQFGEDKRCPAVTGACLLIGRKRFLELGGFPLGYRYGTEDVDLGLQITAAGGSVVCCGRAHLIHHESSTQDREGRAFKRDNRLANQTLFLERWGPRIRREFRLSKLRGGSFWTEAERPRIAITLTSVDPADRDGDWYTAHELGDALQRRGWSISYVQRQHDEGYHLPEDLDYLLVLFDRFGVAEVPIGVMKLAWVRNWTDRWLESGALDRYDQVLASSRISKELIERAAGIEAADFPLATNPRRFCPQPAEAQLAADVVYTGNRWGQPRAVEGSIPEAVQLRMFGRGWGEVPELAAYCAEELPYERLAAAYCSAKVVLDDCAGHTLPYGAVNSRVFDALACGIPVLTNCASGVHELFDEEFPTWSDSRSLRERLQELIGDGVHRARVAGRYQRIVLERHTYDHRAEQLERLVEEAETRLGFCIKSGANDRAVAATWGDTHFAEALARELRRRGHRSHTQVLDEWEDPAGYGYDVVIHLKGLSRYHPKPGQFNVLWCISHPELLTDEECEDYDLVCVASKRFARELQQRLRTPVAELEQATDPRVFYPEPDARYAHELVFVANSRKVMRRTMSDLLPTGLDLAVYGTNWHGLIDERYIVAEHVDNRELRKVYSSSAIVLNDHWEDMREHGFISNRIYDALACGALVVSDELPELHERFGEAVVTYRGGDELRSLLDHMLASPDERAERGRKGMESVLERDTFAHRVDELLGLVARHSDEHLGRIVRDDVTSAGPAPRQPRHEHLARRLPAAGDRATPSRETTVPPAPLG